MTTNKCDLLLCLPPMVWGVHYKYRVDVLRAVFAYYPYERANYFIDYLIKLKFIGFH